MGIVWFWPQIPFRSWSIWVAVWGAACVGSLGAEGEEGGGGKRAEVLVGLRSLRKDQMLSVSIARRLLKAHVMPGFQLRKSVCYIFTYTNNPDVKAFTHCCPHMADSGNDLNISAIIKKNSLQLVQVKSYKWAKILVEPSVWLMLLLRRNVDYFLLITKSRHTIFCII